MSPEETKQAQAMLNVAIAQRNRAEDELIQVTAKLIVLTETAQELAKKVDELTPAPKTKPKK